MTGQNRSDDALCYLTAEAAMAQFRARTLSPVELLEALIRRAEAVEPKINAFAAEYFDEARQKARAAEAKFQKTDGRIRALEGIPVAIKDSGDIRGKITSKGSLTSRDFVASHTSPVNARIIRAGAVVHARSATPEFSCATVCHSKLHGVTRNPWNAALTPGGSSGGAGASLAAGTSTLASGSDIGGSIRIPAGCCGVYGLKPTYGRNPNDPPFNLDFYCHPGPLARSVADIVRFQNVMCGPHPEDIASLSPKLRLSAEPKPIAGWRVAASYDLGFFEVDPEVRANMNAALDLLVSLGATVEEVDLGWDWGVLDAGARHLAHVFGSSIAPLLESAADLLTPYARRFAEASLSSTPQDYLSSLTVVGEIGRQFGAMMARYELFVCPTNAIPAAPAAYDAAEDAMVINGVEVPPMIGWCLTTPFNMLSRCPVLAAPSGWASNGAPTGVQLVGRPYRDQDVIRAGLAYEAAGERLGLGRRPDL